MAIELRPYQHDAVNAVMAWVKHTTSPCAVEAATGAGKSLMIADISRQLYELSGGKRVLCLAPSGELVEQNHEKFELTGNKASIYSASVSKSLRHDVVFATELSFKKVARRIGKDFCAVIVDECHKLTDTIKDIIEDMQEGNENLRVIGFTATPYRTKEGYIYSVDDTGKVMPESQAKEPFFAKLVYRITAKFLIDSGYLTPIEIGSINDKYDTSKLTGSYFKPKEIDRAFVGHGRKTSGIVADVVSKSVDKMGVMFFTATVAHAYEVLASLPTGLSRIVTGDTGKAERRKIVQDFKAMKFKYLVSVGALTTGFDAPHVDVIAMMRKTVSAGLFQQIIGRGMRIHERKESCLLLDYAENIEFHFPDGDIFNPEIRAQYAGGSGTPIDITCPSCGGVSEYKIRPELLDPQYNEFGFLLDLSGEPILDINGLNVPVHSGQRCQSLVKVGKTYDRCTYRWAYKVCKECNGENSYSARRCTSCGGELIDPNENLVGEFKAIRRDPYMRQTGEVIALEEREQITKSMQKAVVIDVTTKERSFSFWLFPDSTQPWLRARYAKYKAAGKVATITYAKNQKSGFFDVFEYNEQATAERILNAVPELAYSGRR